MARFLGEDIHENNVLLEYTKKFLQMFYAIQQISDLITFLQECFQFKAYLVYLGPK